MFNKITDRDAAAIRRSASVLREFAPIVSGGDTWRPFVPGMLVEGAFASRFSVASRALYLIVNRRGVTRTGPIIAIPCRAGTRYYDVWHGHELPGGCVAGKLTVSFVLEGGGFGAILEVGDGAEPPAASYLEKMRVMTAAELSSFSATRQFLRQTMTPLSQTAPADGAPGMALVTAPDGGAYDFECAGNIQQGGMSCLFEVLERLVHPCFDTAAGCCILPRRCVP